MAGIYTDRGTQQCGPSPGSLAHEAMDAQQFARWGFDYVKSDDCFASLDYQTGMRDYGTFGRALKATGRDIYYLICGCKLGVGSPDPRVGWEQCPREAAALTGANAWRIASDDYTWSNVIMNANINAAFAEFSTFQHRNDPDMLIGTPLVPGGWPSERQCPNLQDWKTVRKRGFPPYSITAEQSRFQFALWCMMAAPLILSLNIRSMSPYDLATYGNAEAIAIDQDSLGLQGVRLVGGNLSLVPQPQPSPPAPPPAPPLPSNLTVIPNYNIVRGQCASCAISPTHCCNGTSTTIPSLEVEYLSKGKAASLAVCEQLCAAFGSVGAQQQQPKRCHSFVWNSINHDCFGRLDAIFDTNNTRYANSPGIYSCTWKHSSSSSSSGGGSAAGRTPSATTATAATTNVWGRKLANNAFALLFLNIGSAATKAGELVCDQDCVRKVVAKAALPTTRWRMRDLWTHQDLPDLVGQDFAIAAPALPAGTGIWMVRVWPA